MNRYYKLAYALFKGYTHRHPEKYLHIKKSPPDSLRYALGLLRQCSSI